MNKLQVGTELYGLLRDTENSEELRSRIMDLVSTIMVEEYKGVVHPEMLSCTKCTLCQNRTQVVPGTGPVPADIMFIGESAGLQEDLQGKPFVGPAGAMLDNILKAACKEFSAKRWQRENIYITNIVKCHPEDNRNPHTDEIEACSNYLLNEIEKVQPRVIVCWGSVAANALIHPNFKITEETGIFFSNATGIKLIALYHPAYILRLMSQKDPKTLSAKQAVWEGIKKIDKYLSEWVDK
jgi:DNA polymerase